MFGRTYDSALANGEPTEFRDLELSATIPVNHPAEPVLAVFADGSVEWVFEGDLGYISENEIPNLIGTMSADDVLAGLHSFIQSNSVPIG